MKYGVWLARRGLTTAAIATASLAAGLGLMRLLSGRPTATPPESPTTASPASPDAARAGAPTVVTDLPLPESINAQALTAYREALQAHRDAMAEGPHLQRAIDLDPTMAAAHLRLAAYEQQADPKRAAGHLRRASQLRAALGERDQGVLQALMPALTQQDFAETRRLLEALRDRFPGDAELAAMHGVACMFVGQMGAATGELESAVALDPRFAWAYWQLGQARLYMGDYEGAEEALDRCLVISPASTDCHRSFDTLRATSGDCRGLLDDARAWTAADPQSEWAWETLARGLVGVGAPVERVQEAVAQQIKWMSDPRRTQAATEARGRLAQLAGSFDEAEQATEKLEKLVAPSSTAEDHAVPARAAVAILREMGRPLDAARVAEDFFARRAEWAVTPTVEYSAVANDPTPALLNAELRAGTIDRATFTAERDTWLSEMTARGPPWITSYLWMHGVAALAQTPEEATEALSLLPKYEPLASFRPFTMVDAGIGRTYVLAGRVDDGLPLLRRAASNCFAFDVPIEWVRAQLWLGVGLEAANDTAGACAAYVAVLSRWPDARPRSITADAARGRAATLHCRLQPPPPSPSRTAPILQEQ